MGEPRPNQAPRGYAPVVNKQLTLTIQSTTYIIVIAQDSISFATCTEPFQIEGTTFVYSRLTLIDAYRAGSSILAYGGKFSHRNNRKR